MSGFLSLVSASFSIHRAFHLSSQGRDREALAHLDQSKFKSLGNRPFLTISIKTDLLRMFLEMELGHKLKSRKILSRIKRSSLNDDEKKFLLRYALSVVWISRGKNSDCVLLIRHNMQINPSRVRRIFKDNFPSPDIEDDGAGASVAQSDSS